MKIVRFSYEGDIFHGKVSGKKISFINKNGKEKNIDIESVKFLPPTVPSKIVCVGLNYLGHAKELSMNIPKEPIIFLKPTSSLIGHLAAINIPKGVSSIDYEAELAVVVKSTAYKVKAEKAYDFIKGYTCFNDVTAREIQKKDVQWTRAKSYDTFAPLGPCLETDLNPDRKKIKCFLNGTKVQDSSTEDLIFPIPELFEFISGVMTLYAGDIITTGTPPGIGRLKKHDTVSVEIEGIGKLENTVG